jgi:uncharacterized tellurite resistance protein B-like protein
MVEIGLYKQLDFKEEVLRYKSYTTSIVDDTEYLSFLVNMIMPVNSLALYSYCVELVLSDSTLGAGEEALLTRIAGLLELEEAEQQITKKLIAQRKVVKDEQII